MPSHRSRRPTRVSTSGVAIAAPAGRLGPTARASDGFSLIEAMVAMTVLTIVVLGLAQVVGVGIVSDKASYDVTVATAEAAAKLEELRSSEFWALMPGGSLDSDVAGYSDNIDTNTDGAADFGRRWQIANILGGKQLEVRVTSYLTSVGPPKSASMSTVVAER